jgi:hypothetical protein
MWSPVGLGEDEELASVKIDQGKPLPDSGEQAVREAVVSRVEADPERCLAEHQERFGYRPQTLRYSEVARLCLYLSIPMRNQHRRRSPGHAEVGSNNDLPSNCH